MPLNSQKMLQLYLWPSGPKPPCEASPPLFGSGDQVEQVYENVELLNRPLGADDKLVVYMNTNGGQRQDNQPVSHILTLTKSAQTWSNIENIKLFHLAVASTSSIFNYIIFLL